MRAIPFSHCPPWEKRKNKCNVKRVKSKLLVDQSLLFSKVCRVSPEKKISEKIKLELRE